MSDFHPEIMNRWTDGKGHIRALGNHPARVGRSLTTQGQLPDIPVSEWRPFNLIASPIFPLKVKDQGNFGACNGHAASSSLELARWIAGESHHALSAWLIYADLCQGIDRGSFITDALEHLSKQGTAREAKVSWGTISPTKITPEARTDATRFRVEIGHKLETFRDLCIASVLRQPFNFSIPVNGNFNSLDAYGRPLNHAGAHNHAVCGGFGLQRLATGEWAFLALNSWGLSFGIGGYFWVSERNLQGWGWDAYSVSATHFDPQTPPPPLV